MRAITNRIDIGVMAAKSKIEFDSAAVRGPG